MSIRDFLEASGARSIKASGQNFISLCPYHADSKRSFSMNAETGKYICFSESCGAKGDLCSFLVTALGYTLERAREIAGEYSEETYLVKARPGGMPDWDQRGHLTECPLMAERLLGIYDFCPKYLLDRMFEKKVLRRWEIGFDNAVNRVTIPVRDQVGRFIGISKRAITEEYPKYLHLNFRKSTVLYGESIHFGDTAWIGEGQLDALALDQLIGPGSAMSTMGARVSEEQTKRMMRFERVVLAFDADKDGVLATCRVGDRLAGWGHRHVFVCDAYPEDVKDPADLLFRDPEDARHFVKNISTYVNWRQRNRSRLSRGKVPQ